MAAIFTIFRKLTAVLADIEETNGNLSRAEADYSRATNQVAGLLEGFPHPRNKNILVATMGRVFQGHFDLAMGGYAIRRTARAKVDT